MFGLLDDEVDVVAPVSMFSPTTGTSSDQSNPLSPLVKRQAASSVKQQLQPNLLSTQPVSSSTNAFDQDDEILRPLPRSHSPEATSSYHQHMPPALQLSSPTEASQAPTQTVSAITPPTAATPARRPPPPITSPPAIYDAKAPSLTSLLSNLSVANAPGEMFSSPPPVTAAPSLPVRYSPRPMTTTLSYPASPQLMHQHSGSTLSHMQLGGATSPGSGSISPDADSTFGSPLQQQSALRQAQRYASGGTPRDQSLYRTRDTNSTPRMALGESDVEVTAAYHQMYQQPVTNRSAGSDGALSTETSGSARSMRPFPQSNSPLHMQSPSLPAGYYGALPAGYNTTPPLNPYASYGSPTSAPLTHTSPKYPPMQLGDTPRSARSDTLASSRGSGGTPREQPAAMQSTSFGAQRDTFGAFGQSSEERFGFRPTNAALDLSAEEEASDSAVAINISQMRAQQQVSAKLSARSSQHTPPYPDGPTLNSLSIAPVQLPGSARRSARTQSVSTPPVGVGGHFPGFTPSPTLQQLQMQQQLLQQQILQQQQYEFAVAQAALSRETTPRPLGLSPRLQAPPPPLVSPPVVPDMMHSSRSMQAYGNAMPAPQQAYPIQRSAREIESQTSAAAAVWHQERVRNEAEAAKKAAQDQLGDLLFSKVRNQRYEEVEDLLVSGKISPDVRDQYGNNILIVACQNGNKKMAKICLRFGANINAQNYKGNTALHYCFSYQYIPLGEYLISKGARDTIVNAFGLTCYEGVSPVKAVLAEAQDTPEFSQERDVDNDYEYEDDDEEA